MQLKQIQLLFWLASVVLFLNSCSDSDEKPSLQISVGDKKFSLHEGTLHLIRETVTYTWNERTYVISDGQLTAGQSGLSSSDFTNSTYFLQVQIGVPTDTEVSTGNYPQTPSWSVANPESNVAYLYLLDTDTNDSYESNSTNEDDSPVVVTGGINDGESMTLEFSGKLSRSDNTHGLTSKLFFKGNVIDSRSL